MKLFLSSAGGIESQKHTKIRSVLAMLLKSRRCKECEERDRNEFVRRHVTNFRVFNSIEFTFENLKLR